MEDLKKKIKFKLKSYGLDVVGFTRPFVVPSIVEDYGNFLKNNYHGDMKWLEYHKEVKEDPKRIWGEVETIIVVGQNYSPGFNPLKENYNKNSANISVYAQNHDYHKIINKKLSRFKSWFQKEFNLESKVFVDTSPIFEKQFAQMSGIGWQGKHTNLVSKKFGSWLFLGEIFLPIKLREDKEEVNNCGRCRDCIDICPTNAIVSENMLDARKCISYLTIEHKGPFPISLRKKIGNKVYGCDDCLSICPWNKFASITSEKDLLSSKSYDLDFYLRFNEEKFNSFFNHSPIKRIGWLSFLRNLIISVGNSQNKEFVSILEKFLQHHNSIIRGTAIWSLSQLLSQSEIKDVKKKMLKKEKNEYVLFELNIIS